MQPCLHGAPAKSQLPRDYPQYVRWEERRYPGGPERRPSVPSKEKLSKYHKIHDLLRIRLCKARRLPDSERKWALIGLIHKRLDENMGLVFHERGPGKWPDPRVKSTFRQPGQGRLPAIRPLLPAPHAEPALASPAAPYARAV